MLAFFALLAGGAFLLLVPGEPPEQATGLQLLMPNFKGSERERAVVSKALAVAERECPSLATLTEDDVDRDLTYKWPLWQVSVGDARHGWTPDSPPGTPFTASFGWKRYVGISIPLRNSGYIRLDLGGGRRPGIASRTAGKYMGVNICNLGPGPGGYTFREVPAMKVIDTLK